MADVKINAHSLGWWAKECVRRGEELSKVKLENVWLKSRVAYLEGKAQGLMEMWGDSAGRGKNG